MAVTTNTIPPIHARHIAQGTRVGATSQQAKINKAPNIFCGSQKKTALEQKGQESCRHMAIAEIGNDQTWKSAEVSKTPAISRGRGAVPYGAHTAMTWVRIPPPLPYTRLAQCECSSFIRKRLSVQVRCLVPFWEGRQHYDITNIRSFGNF